MTKIITIMSNDNKSGSSTISFNLANILNHKNKKILIIHLNDHSPYIPILQSESSKKKNLAPFDIENFDKNIDVLLLSNDKTKSDHVKLLQKQISINKDKYDFIVIDNSYKFLDLGKIICELSNEIIWVMSTKTFSLNKLTEMLFFIKDLKKDNKSLKMPHIILNNYCSENPLHVSIYLQISKMITNKKLLTTLSHKDELSNISSASLKFTKNIHFDDYTMNLKKLITTII